MFCPITLGLEGSGKCSGGKWGYHIGCKLSSQRYEECSKRSLKRKNTRYIMHIVAFRLFGRIIENGTSIRGRHVRSGSAYGWGGESMDGIGRVCAAWGEGGAVLTIVGARLKKL